MLDTITSPRQSLLQRSERFHRELRFDLAQGKYVVTVRAECGTKGYRDEPEPVVKPDPYHIAPACLTVNSYNALVLNSPNLLIVDIDAGDPRFSQHAMVLGDEDVLANIRSLNDFDQVHRTDLRKQSWRIYETHSGWRVICTSKSFKADWFGEQVLRFFRSDPRYIEMCRKQQCFRARLTPKPWREGDGGHCVCRLIESVGTEVSPVLAEQVRLHDELTLPEHDYSTLA